MATKKSANSNLHSAKREKNDEFYTQLSDIEKELKHYRKHFIGKTVFCNCDDPESSNFWLFFSLNFDKLQLQRLISTHYETEKTSYMLEMWRDDSGVHSNIRHLTQNGDFQSQESIALLQQADIVVTNPPFSLFRDYIAQLMEYDKKFLVLGSQNAITYKEIFPLLKDNKMWLGYHCGEMAFKVPDYYEPRATRFWIDESGQKWRSLGNICWFTNLDHQKRHEQLIMVKKYTPEAYPHYDNYDAINCDKVADIPMDYFESWGILHDDFVKLNAADWEITREDVERKWIVPAHGNLREELVSHTEGYREHIESVLMQALYCAGQVGMPITMLDSHNPEQFDVVRFRKGNDGKDLTYTVSGGSALETDRSVPISGLSFAADIKYCSGVLGVPITFLNKFCPEQFTIIGHEHDINGNGGSGIPNGQFESQGRGFYKRILSRAILPGCNGYADCIS